MQHPQDELQAAEVEALAAYDEELRQGVEVVATGSVRTNDSVLRGELADCVRFLEEVWPRGASASANRRLPTSIGRFKIERLLGQGGFGIVYLAQDPILGRQVALKVPRLHALASEELRARFRREGRAMAALDHPNIVPIYELGEVGPTCYIAFALCEGPSLAQWLREQPAPIAPRAAAKIVQQLAEAMHYSHGRGVLHRDLKPNNVLLFPSSGSSNGPVGLGFVPRIVDFGLASLAEEDLETRGTSAIVGTPFYMAPEQALGGAQSIGPAADVYSLGAILYELLSGQPPFTGDAPLEVLDRVRSAEPKPLAGVPRDLETICLCCLRKGPADRYASAQELADDLQRFVEDQQVRARSLTVWQRVYRTCQQPQRIREAGIAVMAINAVVIFSMFVTIYMVQAGKVLPRPASFEIVNWVALPSVFMFVGHLPQVYVGWMILRERRWAAWISLFTGGFMTVLAMMFIVGIIPEGMTRWDEIPGFRVFFPMLTVLLIAETAMSAIALLALNKKRQR